MSQGYITEEIGKVTLNQPEVVTLLSPIRDAQYLKSLQNPTSTAPDAGLGVIDNPFFFVAGHYPGGLSPTGAPEDRTYLVWFGSPKGTTNEKPQFSVFYAKVHPERYVPNAPAETWLDPPVLLVSYDQISSDVVNWADNVFTSAGYTPSSPGVINVPNNAGYIPNYGYVDYPNSPSPVTLNFTGTPELKQLHMVYDMLDDTVLMYFSITVPNWNPGTKAQYVYKFPVSLLKSQQSINQYAVSGLTPTTTSTPPPNDKPYFLGGLKFDSTIEQTIVNAFRGFTWGNAIQMQSAPQFAISFDWYKLGGFMGYKPSNGFLPAIYVGNPLYMTAMSGINYNYPHGDSLIAIAFADIHKNPAQPQTYYQPIMTSYGMAFPAFQGLPPNLESCPSSYGSNSYYCIPILGFAGQLDTFDLGLNIDKFGSIVPGESFGIHGAYAIPIALPPRPDWGGISSIRMKMLYVAPIFHQFQGYGGLSFAWTRDSVEIPYYPEMGTCRPYLTTLPDGKLKVTMGGYHADNYLDGVAIYLDKSAISPKGKTLVTVPPLIFGQTSPGGSYYVIAGANGPNSIYHGVVTHTFGKKYARVYLNINAGNNVFVNIYTRYRSRSAPDLQQMYGNSPNPNNTANYYPVVERSFGTLVYATDYSYNMPYALEYSRTSKFRVDGQVLWVLTNDGNGPVWVELEGD